MCCTLLLSKLRMTEKTRELVIIIHPNCEMSLGMEETVVRESNRKNYTT